MKKIKGAILLASLAFFNIGIVKAEDRCATLKLNAEDSSFQSMSPTHMDFPHNGINSHAYYKFIFTGKDDTYVTYCRNAGIASGKTPGKDKTYSCNQTVFDPTSANETEKIYHAGIMGILLNGYSYFNNNYYNVANVDEEYVATNIALRVYELFWDLFNTNGSNSTDWNRAHQYIANLMLEDSEIQEKLVQAAGKVRDKFSNPLAVSKIGNEDFGVNNSIIKESRRLLILGLDQSIDYKNNGAAKVTYNNPQVFKNNISFSLKAENFRDKDSYLNLNLDCPNCNKYGVSYKTYINGEEMDIKDADLLKKLDQHNKINLEVVLTSNSNYNCELLDLNLKIKYKDKSLLGEAYSMQADGFSSSASIQHFYLLYSKDTVKDEEIPIESKDICPLDCEEIKQRCNAGNQEMCKRLEDEFGGDCVKCTAFVSPIKCGENDQDLYIQEGLELNSNTESCKANKDTKLNILQCVVNNKDKAGKSYKAADLTNNRYCRVYCKEDYHFVLPGIKEARSGRYFSLQASVNGKKSCYTSKLDTASFEKDLEAARKKIIDAYNKWSRLDAIVNTEFTGIKQMSRTCGSGCKDYVCHFYDQTKCCEKRRAKQGLCEAELGIPSDYSRWLPGTRLPVRYVEVSRCDTSKTYTWEVAKKEIRYQNCDAAGNCKTVEETLEFGTKTGNVCNSGVTNYSDDYNSKNYEEQLGEITKHTAVTDLDPGKGYSYTYSAASGVVGELQSAINSYFLILNNYNSCGGYSNAVYDTVNSVPFKYGWKINYNYDAKVSFWYLEKYMLDVMSDHLSALGSVNIDDDYTQTNCYGNVSNDYKCLASSDNNKASMVTIKKQFMCMRIDDTYKCDYYNVAVTNAKYVSQSKGMEAEYITPTQFQKIYPTNAIVVADENEKIENGSVIPSGLPISGGTGQGGYTYALKVEDLGEYYNSTKTSLGRIWGASDSVVVNTLKDLKACYKDSTLKEAIKIKSKADGKIESKILSNGVYICAYRVNCPDCPIECDEDGCEWEDCPTNKCPIDCDDCLITNGDYNFDYRPVTPGDLNPNNRPLGSNWNWDKSITDAIELKAYTTTKEIETIGEEIYDTTKDSYIMKVKMDSALISAVREYNDQHGGNYLTNTLKCYDLNENGNVYENVFCYSTFLDEMIQNHSDNFKFNKKRPRTEAERKNSKNSEYWTTWSKAIANETWNITTINSMEIAKIDKIDAKSTNYKNEIGIGPSWK